PDFRGVPISKNFMHLKRERHCPRSLATTFSRQVLSIKVGFHEPAVQVILDNILKLLLGLVVLVHL
ncbi:MAG: hypothetical protein VXX29_11800, partial [Verrucomicrobiota bacterium]|nr:hypothetical protein [Verrucomicrobiota bacterium]